MTNGNYKVVRGPDANHLVDFVKESDKLISAGYQPLGSIIVVNGEIMQAFWKQPSVAETITRYRDPIVVSASDVAPDNEKGCPETGEKEKRGRKPKNVVA